MPRNVCCVPGCPVVAEDGVPLHWFPCPEKDAERFQNWVKIIGGDIATLDSTTVRKIYRICRRHFQKGFLYPKNRLCKLAVPSLFLPSADVSASSQIVSDCQPSTSQEVILLDSNVIQDSTTAEYNPCNSAPSQMVLDCQPSTSQETILLDYNVIQDSTTAEYNPCNSAPRSCPLVFECIPSTSQEVKLHRDVIQPTTTRTVEYSKPSSTEPSYFLKWKNEENKVRKLEQTLRRVRKAKQTYRKKYLEAKKMRKAKAFEIVTQNMSSIIKSLFYMQVKGSNKKCRGRRFTPEEKTLALSLYKSSPNSYRLLSQLCVLPSRRTLRNILQKADLKPRIDE